jgi:multicomponent K+:H+ antiporter subunit A
LHAPGIGWAIAATLSAALSVGYSLRLVRAVFLGPVRGDYPRPPHDPGAGLWLAPGLLVALVVLIGLMPDQAAGWLVRAAATAVTGAEAQAHLALWHGWSGALGLSALAVAAGLALLARRGVWQLPLPDARRIFDRVAAGVLRLARLLGDGLGNGSMARALAALLVVILACAVLAYAGPGQPALSRPMLPAPPVAVIGWLVLMLACLAMTACHRDRLLALVLVGIVGLMVSGLFLYLSAPDLALTQITVEVVTVILLLMALNFLPRRSRRDSAGARRGFDAGLSVLAGLGFGGLAWVVMRSPPELPSISGYMLRNSHALGGGDNVVNVILVDFLGYDTFGEITVLGIAALVIFALAQALLAGALPRHSGRGPGDHPQMLAVVARLVLPMTLAVGLHMFLRGHNLPGGGFVAGLIVAAALMAQYMAMGQAWVHDRNRLAWQGLIGAGLAVAGLTGIGAWLAGRPFLTSWHDKIALPGLEPFELASAMGFDLGVFLCVLGAVMLALDALARLARALRGGPGAKEAEWNS